MEKVIRPRAIIVDIDNVLVDARALEIYTPADPHSRGGWDIFHQHLHEVTINDFIVNLVNLYRNAGYSILFVTSREDIRNCRQITFDTISRALIGDLVNVWLFMRNAEDYRCCDIVKGEIYDNIIKESFDVELVLDDSPSNCKMFQEKGLHTFQVAI